MIMLGWWAVILGLAVGGLLGVLISTLWHRRGGDLISRLLSKVGQVPTYQQALPVFSEEISRARRYQNPVSVAVLRLQHEADAQGKTGSVESLMTGLILRDSLRSHDIVCYDAVKDRYIILILDAKWQALQTVQRLKAIIRERIQLDLPAGVAEFPNDGFVVESLVTQADEASRRRTDLRPAGEPVVVAQVSRSALS